MNPERPATKDLATQPTALGILAFQRTQFFTSGLTTTSILAVNSDGTGQVTLASADVPPVFILEPAWSPDGTKIAYVSDFDIWVMAADGSGKVNITNNGQRMLERNPSWSPSGLIAFEGDGQIWTMAPDGSGQTPFYAITQLFPSDPAWSPDGTKLLFTTADDIWVINSDGTNQRRVTNNSVPDTDPAWSPDGQKIIFGKAGNGIAVIGLDGSNEILLTNGANDSSPSWSNDGTKIAFVRRGSTVNGIYTMDAVGGNQLRIVADIPGQPGQSENDNPVWRPVAAVPNTVIVSGRISRNGESLVGAVVELTGSMTLSTVTNALGEYRFENLPKTGTYTITPIVPGHVVTPVRRIFTDPTANQIADFTAGQTCSTPNCRVNGKIAFVRGPDIFISNADGTGPVNLTGGAGINDKPAFSPDGGKIAFQSNRDGDFEIYQMNVDGSGQQRLTFSAGADEKPTYSPDGKKIAFVSSRDGNQEIYSINAADGSAPLRLTNNAVPDLDPVFSPDGTKITFSRPFNEGTPTGQYALFTMNTADGSNAVQITTPPSSLNDLTASYSPDGTKIVFWRSIIGAGTSELYTANADGTSVAPLGVSGIVFKPSYSPDGTQIIYSRLFSPFRYDIEAVPVGGGPANVLVQDGNFADWQPLEPAVRRTPFDFDGDGRSDLSVFRPSERIWYLLQSEAGFTAYQFGVATDLIVPADYDGDGKTDVAVWRPSDGNFYVLNSSDLTVRIEHFGSQGDVPTPQDWDGDGKADLSVYRPGPQSFFYYRGSAGDPYGSVTYIPWGVMEDKPVPGDYDGDGLIDAAVFRPSNGVWYIRKSSDGQLSAYAFGLQNDQIVPADYDGDNRTDLGIYRNGVWYLLLSTEGFSAFQYGLAGDVPVPADYDGDGRADAAIYRDGVWYCLRSTGESLIVPFGLGGDKPTPSAFVR